MKKLLLAALLLAALSSQANAQSWKNPLPLDSATHRVVYTGVVAVPGATKDELYSRAREWFATNFGSAKAVLEMDDREAGKLIGNANSQFMLVFGGILASTPMRLWRTIRVELKDGKYRYTLANFDMGSPTSGQAAARPVESWFDKPAEFAKDGTPKKVTASVIDAIQASGESQVASLQAAMTKKASKDKDW
jgi:opacity protein-like surface antigen